MLLITNARASKVKCVKQKAIGNIIRNETHGWTYLHVSGFELFLNIFFFCKFLSFFKKRQNQYSNLKMRIYPTKVKHECCHVRCTIYQYVNNIFLLFVFCFVMCFACVSFSFVILYFCLAVYPFVLFRYFCYIFFSCLSFVLSCVLLVFPFRLLCYIFVLLVFHFVLFCYFCYIFFILLVFCFVMCFACVSFSFVMLYFCLACASFCFVLLLLLYFFHLAFFDLCVVWLPGCFFASRKTASREEA